MNTINLPRTNYFMKFIAWLTLKIFMALNNSIGYEKPTERGVAMRPWMRRLWSWWNGQGVFDGKSMRYHLYSDRAFRNLEDDDAA